MGRGKKGGYCLHRGARLIGVFLQPCRLAVGRIDAHRQAIRKGEEFAAFGQRDQVFDVGLDEGPGAAAGHGEVRQVEDLAGMVGEDQFGQAIRMGK